MYDANGNVTTDGRLNKTISYNLLNLPQSISGGLAYTYTATGQKIRKVSENVTTDYAGGIQYTNGNIDLVQTEEGLARISGSNYSYEYDLKDHLGNTMATFYRNPASGQVQVVQRDDYYAFGLQKSSLASTNKYLYNGKELQDELGQYDYGARFYDPVIAKWTSVDPLAEKARRWSPYVYGDNNPIRNIDPDGMQTQGCCGVGLLIDKKTTQYVSQKAIALEKAVIKGAVGFATAASEWLGGQNSHRAFDKDPQVRAEAKPENARLSKEIVSDLAVGYAGGKLLGMGAKALSGSAAEVSVFRVYGQDAKADGFSWSPVNPNSVGNYRDAAGLPSGGASGSMNSGQFVIDGTVKPNAVITNRAALPLDGNKGGIPEYIINPKNVTSKRVSGANPNF